MKEIDFNNPKKKMQWNITFPFSKLRKDQASMIMEPLKYINKIPIILLDAPNGKGKTSTALTIGTTKLHWNKINNYYKEMFFNEETSNQFTDEQKMVVEKLFNDENINKIYFLNRTHRQVQNFIDTIKILNKKRIKEGIEPIKIVEWMSRKELCINRHCLLSKYNNFIDFICKSVLHTSSDNNTRWCTDPDDFNYKIHVIDKVPPNTSDISDQKSLIEYGKKYNLCPYYLSRTLGLSDITDSIICTYNYIFDPFIRKVLQLRMNNSLIVVDECLTGDTLIAMEDGSYKKIVDVKDGDVVIGGKVSNKFKKTVEKIVKINTEYESLKTTMTHPNFIITSEQYEKYYRLNDNKDCIVQVIQSKDIKSGDYLLIPKKHEYVHLNEYEAYDLRFIGKILSNGGALGCLGEKENSKTLLRLYNSNKTDNKKGKFSSNPDELHKFIAKFNIPFKDGIYSVNINDEVFKSNLISIKSFIQVCFDLKGEINKERKMLFIESLSLLFIKRLKLLLLKFGIKSKIEENSHNKRANERIYYLCIYGYDLVLFNNEIGFNLTEKSNKLNILIDENNEIKKQKIIVFNDQEYIPVKINKLEIIDKKTEVYDFTTETHTFIANGFLTHNCHNIEKVIEGALKQELEVNTFTEVLKLQNLPHEMFTFLNKASNFINYIVTNYISKLDNNTKQKMIEYDEFGKLLSKFFIARDDVNKVSELLPNIMKDPNLFHYMNRLMNIISHFNFILHVNQRKFKLFEILFYIVELFDSVFTTRVASE